jgi:hypothetical protein
MTEPMLDLIAVDQRELVGLTRLERPTIKILLYTDAPFDVVKEPVGKFGLGRMINLLHGHGPAFAELCVKWESRYPKGSTHAENKIHVVMKREEDETGQPFDQIWFFGLHQVNKKNFNPRLGGGGPESELVVDEVKALRAWMDRGGGVLMTGDHANLRPKDALPPDPNPPCPYQDGNHKYAGLGRALGRCVPRAGELRDWDGPPTAREEDSNNTQVTPFIRCGEPFPAQILFQRDRIPQQLILPTFDEKGKPALGGQPHPLFFYREGCGSIQFFPDHLHEGEVVIPDSFPDTIWPKNDATKFQPLPREVAYGLDKRSGNKIKLLAAYDGSLVDVGRIVADSAWHHYFNINLSGFTQPTGPGSPIDQIGQFYGNLAVWLSPTIKRFEMAEAMFRWLGQDPEVLEALGPPEKAKIADRWRAGAAARGSLSQVSSPCEIHELLQMTIPKYYSYVEQFETLYFPEKGYNLTCLPSQELLLGCVIKQYPRELFDDTGAALTDVKRNQKVRAAFEAGTNEAFFEQGRKVLVTSLFAKNFLTKARPKASALSAEERERGAAVSSSVRQSSERSNVMSVCATRTWEMTLTRSGSLPSDTDLSFRDIEYQNGRLTGKVVDTDGNETPLYGTCAPLGEATQPPGLSFMNFQFIVLGGDESLVGIFMTGFGYVNEATDKPVFGGVYYASDALEAINVAGSNIRAKLAVDPGETGTGNGNGT